MRNNRRVIVSAPGGDPILSEGAIPTPGAGEIRIRITAAALNFADLLMIEGRYQDKPPFPFTPGLEVAGVVETCGPNTNGPPPGTRVAAQIRSGGFADYAVLPVSAIQRIPDDIPDQIAAACQITYCTAEVALRRRANLRCGETLLVLGAAGGAGLAAVATGKALGARVIAIAREAGRLETAKSRGADETVDQSSIDDLHAALKSIGPAHVLYDTVGGDDAIAAQRCLSPEGRHLLIGFAGGDLPSLKPNHLLVKNLDVIGVNWNHYLRHCPQVVVQCANSVFDRLSAGEHPPHIGATYPLEQFGKALARLRNRDVTGKIVLIP